MNKEKKLIFLKKMYLKIIDFSYKKNFFNKKGQLKIFDKDFIFLSNRISYIVNTIYKDYYFDYSKNFNQYFNLDIILLKNKNINLK